MARLEITKRIWYRPSRQNYSKVRQRSVPADKIWAIVQKENETAMYLATRNGTGYIRYCREPADEIEALVKCLKCSKGGE